MQSNAMQGWKVLCVLRSHVLLHALCTYVHTCSSLAPVEAVCAAEVWDLLTSDTDKRRPSLQDAQDETEEVLFDIVGKLLKRTNTNPLEVCLPFPTAMTPLVILNVAKCEPFKLCLKSY